MDNTLPANDFRPGDITISPILGSDGWFIFGEIVQTTAGFDYSQLGVCSTQEEAVETARELCRLDGVGLIWLYGADGHCTQVPQFPGPEIASTNCATSS